MKEYCNLLYSLSHMAFVQIRRSMNIGRFLIKEIKFDKFVFMLKRPELFQNGFHLTYFPMGEEIRTIVEQEDWPKLDQEFKTLTKKDGRLFEFLKQFHEFNEIEFIISIRDSLNEWEEDGIWHDDGSRVFAFSLSLTLDADKISGGRLGVREKGSEKYFEIPTPSFGGIILFLTGVYGYEHKIHQVLFGKRIIIAGWCS